jgi:hypothetical protein
LVDKTVSTSDFIRSDETVSKLMLFPYFEDGHQMYAVRFSVVRGSEETKYKALGDTCGFHDFIDVTQN